MINTRDKHAQICDHLPPLQRLSLHLSSQHEYMSVQEEQLCSVAAAAGLLLVQAHHILWSKAVKHAAQEQCQCPDELNSMAGATGLLLAQDYHIL